MSQQKYHPPKAAAELRKVMFWVWITEGWLRTDAGEVDNYIYISLLINFEVKVFSFCTLGIIFFWGSNESAPCPATSTLSL